MTSCDIGIDLGTTNIKIYIEGKGIVIDEPSVIAVDKKTKKLKAIGTQAYHMIGKAPDSLIVKYPLKAGVISDYELNEMMIQEFLRRASNNMLIKPSVCICIHTLITDVERRAVVEAAVASDARKVYLIEEPIAAALGAGISLADPKGVMVVDIGGGTTDVAVLSMNGIVNSRSIKVGGQKIDEMIAKKTFQNYKMLIGVLTAEHVKKEIGTVINPDPKVVCRVCGRSVVNGLPKAILLSQPEIYNTIQESVSQIVHTIHDVLETTPPELAGDILSDGIILTGGGALFSGMPELIQKEIGVQARLADDPLGCVAVGTGKAFHMLDRFNIGFIDAATYGI